jgi:hypothetical protein
LGGGPPGFTRDSTCPVLLGNTTGRPVTFRLRGRYPLWPAFPCRSARCGFCYSLEAPALLLVGPTTPARQRRRAITPHRFRLIPVRSPLLRESRLLSFPHPTEMFQFRQFPPQALCVQAWVTGHDPCRVSPFGHPRISALLAAPRGFSQPHASFLGSWRLGIHRGPFLTWPRCSRSLCGSQGSRAKGARRRTPRRPEGSHPQDRTACPAGLDVRPGFPKDPRRPFESADGVTSASTWSFRCRRRTGTDPRPRAVRRCQCSLERR